jgi:lipoprotein-anchoring transpeptidase ErfK/SrfK
MMLAACRGDLEVLRLLMKYGGKRGSQTKGWKRFPVNFACENAQIPAAQLLLGQDPDGKRKTRIVVSLAKQKAWIYKGDELVRSTDISTGKTGFTTPPGKYVISDKQADWKSSIYKVPMPFFMRLSCKDFGLHAGVVSGGGRASHGCVRLPAAQAEAFFGVMQIGDPVTILE